MGRVWRLGPLAVLLAGCATAPADPTAMIPTNVQATVIAEDKLREAREQANAGDPAARPTSVQDMLARARTAEAQSPPAGGGAEGGAPPASPAAAAPGAPSAGAPPSGAAAVAARAPKAAPTREFEIMFDGPDDKPAPAELAAFQKAWKAAKVPAKSQVMITAGPGGGSSAFEQALLANRRLRTVRSLLPAELDARQHYDPEFVPDTVRIVVGSTD